MLTKTIAALLITSTVTSVGYNHTKASEIVNSDSQQVVTQLPTKNVSPITQNIVASIAQNIVVQVNVGGHRSSGILIANNDNTYTVIANILGAERENSYSIVTPDGIQHEGSLLGFDKRVQNDLVALRFNSRNNYAVAKIGNSNNIKIGETVIAAGFVDGQQQLLVTEGKISLFTKKPLQKGYSIGFSNETLQGMSGGVLLNSNGEVVAVLGKGNAILDTAYNYIDGTTPKRDEIAQYRKSNFSIPITDIANISPWLASLFSANNSRVTQKQKEEFISAQISRGNKRIDEKIDDIAQKITVRIATPELDSHGSGVIIARNDNTYYVATAGHVLDKNGEYTIITPDGKTHSLNNETIAKSNAYDFALFSFTSDKNYATATIGNYNTAANRPQIIFVSGFPKADSLERIITGGFLIQQDYTDLITKDSFSFISVAKDRPGLLYSNPSYKGMSGGAVLDSEGRLIGINVGAENELYFNEEGNNREIAIGSSLGISFRDIFSFIDRETELKNEWLQISNDSPDYLRFIDYYIIDGRLLSVEQPEDNSDLVAWMNYGNQLWRYGRYDKAAAAFNRVLAINPDFDRAYYGMGLAYWYQNDYEQAVTSLEKAIQINPNSYFYWRWLGASYGGLKQYDKAIAAYDKAISDRNTNDFVLYLEQANLLSKNKNYQEAIATYNKAIELNPQNHWIYNNRAVVYTKLARYEEALADYTKAIELNPQLVAAYNNRGLVYDSLKQYQKALDDYTKAIEIAPNSISAYHNRGLTYSKIKRYDLAMVDFHKAIAFKRKDIRNTISQQPIDGNTEKYQQELANLNRILQLDFDREELGIEYGKWKKSQQQLARYDKEIELNPNNSNAYIVRGQIYASLKQYQQAFANYDKATEIDPSNTDPYLLRGRTYEDLKQYQKAVNEYNKAIDINPDLAGFYVALGSAYEFLENKEQAQINYQKAEQLFIAQGKTVEAEVVTDILKRF